MTIAQLYAFAHSPLNPQYMRYDRALRFLASLAPISQEDIQADMKYNEHCLNYMVTRPTLCGDVDRAKTAFDISTREHEVATLAASDNAATVKFYQKTLDCLTGSYLHTLSELLTQVYQSVFLTSNRYVELSLDDYRGKKVIRLNLHNVLDGVDYKEELASQGGAAQAVLGIVIQVYYIMITNSARVMFIDEALSALSGSSLNRFLGILKGFVADLGFIFCVIAHDSYRYDGYADVVYTVDDGEYTRVAPDVFFKDFNGGGDE